MKIEQGYNSCWYNRLQAALCLLAFLTFGIGDAVTSVWMIEQRGIAGEGNIIVRQMILNFGVSDFILIKLIVTAVLVLLPFLMFKENVFWTISGYLLSFIIAGTLGTILNIQAARNIPLFLSTGQAMSLFIALVLALTSIGEQLDKNSELKIRPYHICALNDIAGIFLIIIDLFKKKE